MNQLLRVQHGDKNKCRNLEHPARSFHLSFQRGFCTVKAFNSKNCTEPGKKSMPWDTVYPPPDQRRIHWTEEDLRYDAWGINSFRVDCMN
jgi:hypothetical protein